MTKPLVNDALWQRLEPLFPPRKPRRARFPGRKPMDYRRILTGILFVLKTGIPWEDLPREMGCGCGVTCLNYLRAWQEAGVWEKLRQVILAESPQARRIDWSRAAAARLKLGAPPGGEDAGPQVRTEAG
jgi:transposase